MTLVPKNDLPTLRKYAAGTNVAMGSIIDRWLKTAEVIASVTLGDITDADGTVITGLTVESVDKNSATYTRKNGETYAAGKVITYTVSSGTRGTTYYVNFSAVVSGLGNPINVRQPIQID